MTNDGATNSEEIAPREKDARLSEYGKRGAQATLAKHGPAHYAALGKKGSATLLARYGREHMVELARKRVEKHGR